MHLALKKTEKFIDMSIPYLLVVLLIITAIDIFFEEIAFKYSIAIDITDNVIILFFLGDLGFKYRRSSSMSQFVKSSWIDIIAVIPFYMIFRVVEEFAFAAEIVKGGQDAVGIAENVEKEASTLTKEMKNQKIMMRSEKMMRYIKILARVPRLAKAVPFFDKPK